MGQPKRYGDWAKLDADGTPREVRYVIMSDEPVFGEMLNPKIYLKLMDYGLPSSTPFTIGPHSMTLGDLLALSTRREAVEGAKARIPEIAHMTPKDFNAQVFNNVEMTLKNLARFEEALAHAP